MKRKPTINNLTILFCLYAGLSNVSLADTPQTHDVPMFHNDDGLGLLQDCKFMQAIALGEITEIPPTVNARSTNCLASIKSVVQVLYSINATERSPTVCIKSIELNWLDVLEHVTAFMKSQPADILQNDSYGAWMLKALQDKYACK